MNKLSKIEEADFPDLPILKTITADLVDLGDDTWIKLFSSAEYRKAKKNEVLQKEGRPVEYFFFLVSGVVREHVLFTDGRDVNATFYSGPALLGSVFTYRANIDAPYSFSMVTPGAYYRIDSMTLIDIVTGHPQGERWLNTLLARSYIGIQRRLLLLLHKNAEERLLEFIDCYPQLMSLVPDYHIASYLGITPVTMHRAKSKLKKT